MTPTSADRLSSEHCVIVRIFRVRSGLCEKTVGLIARSHLGVQRRGRRYFLTCSLHSNVFRYKNVSRDGGFPSLFTPNALCERSTKHADLNVVLLSHRKQGDELSCSLLKRLARQQRRGWLAATQPRNNH